MPSLNVVESSIIAFGNHRRQGIVGNANLRIMRDHPVHDPIGHTWHIQWIGQGNRILEKTRFADPGKAGQFASPIEHERSGRYFLVPDILAGYDDCHTGSYRTKPRLKRSVSGDTSNLTHGNASDICDSVKRSRLIKADDDAKSTGSRPGFF